MDRDRVAAFVATRPSWHLTLLWDPTGHVGELYKPSMIPISYVIDERGIIRSIHEGAASSSLGTIAWDLHRLVH